MMNHFILLPFTRLPIGADKVNAEFGNYCNQSLHSVESHR